jgi:hypothetical protein
MTDLKRDLEEVGKTVWPDPEQVRRRVPDSSGRRWRSPRTVGAILATAAVAALIGVVSAPAIIAVEQHLTASTTSTKGAPVVGAGTHSSNGGATGKQRLSGPSSPAASDHNAPPPAVSFSPTPVVHSPSSGGSLTLTQQSRGTYVVTLGSTITVTLTGGTPSDPWIMPTSRPDQIVHFARGDRSSAGDVIATFVATAFGQATIQASLSRQCPPLCGGAPTYIWHVQVTVVA